MASSICALSPYISSHLTKITIPLSQRNASISIYLFFYFTNFHKFVAEFWCCLKEASAKWAGGVLRLRELWPPAFLSPLLLSLRRLSRLPKVDLMLTHIRVCVCGLCWVLVMLCLRRRNLGSGFERLPFKAEGYNYWTWRGHKIHYVVQGEGSPIVLIHGFGASAFHWRFFSSCSFSLWCQ